MTIFGGVACVHDETVNKIAPDYMAIACDAIGCVSVNVQGAASFVAREDKEP